MKIDIEADNVFYLETTTEAVRNEDKNLIEELALKMDEAQGHAFTGRDAVSYVVIKITKGAAS